MVEVRVYLKAVSNVSGEVTGMISLLGYCGQTFMPSGCSGTGTISGARMGVSHNRLIFRFVT